MQCWLCILLQQTLFKVNCSFSEIVLIGRSFDWNFTLLNRFFSFFQYLLKEIFLICAFEYMELFSVSEPFLESLGEHQGAGQLPLL